MYFLPDEKGFVNSWFGFFIHLIIILILLLYLLSIGIRRLHDLGFSGWFILFLLVPLVNIAFTILLVFRAGDKQENKYGSQPKPVFECKSILGIK